MDNAGEKNAAKHGERERPDLHGLTPCPVEAIASCDGLNTKWPGSVRPLSKDVWVGHSHLRGYRRWRAIGMPESVSLRPPRTSSARKLQVQKELRNSKPEFSQVGIDGVPVWEMEVFTKRVHRTFRGRPISFKKTLDGASR